VESWQARVFPTLRSDPFLADRTIRGKGKIIVACAGTSDMPVAEEAQLTAEAMGNEVKHQRYRGAGIHRLMSSRERLAEARVIVVCAGMEGALPSAVGGLVSCPSSRSPPVWAMEPALTPGGAARHVEQLLQQRHGGQHR